MNVFQCEPRRARELSREANGVGERVKTNIAAWFLSGGKGAGHVWRLSYGRPVWVETAARNDNILEFFVKNA